MNLLKFFFISNIKVYVGFYLLVLALFSIFFLYFKHDVSNDSSISEMLINYSGGFTRRGLPGHLFIIISEFLNIKLRIIIFFFQTLIQLVYFFLIYIYIKDLKLDRLLIIIIFLPIFLSHTIYEIESLGRKDVFIFTFYTLMLILSEKFKSPSIVNYFTFFTLSVLCLIWEPFVFFFPFIFLVLFLKNKPKKILQIFKIFLYFIPSLTIVALIYFFPLSANGHFNMCEMLQVNFGEKCYMSASLLLDQGINFTTFDFVHKNANFYNYLRYLFIFFIGFFPIYYYAYNIQLSKNIFLIPKFLRNLLVIFLLFNFPILLLFFFGYDWGRWIVFTYTFSSLTLFFLIKNHKLRHLNIKNIREFFIFKLNNTYYIFFFVIFTFLWNIKTVITDKIGSFPIYRTILKFAKFVDLKYLN